MAENEQFHSGIGSNVGRDQNIFYYPHSPNSTHLSKYLNAFPHYDLANLVGREEQLYAIDQRLKQRKMLLLQGIGGVGKTTLAKAYITQFGFSYNHIAYVELAGTIAESMQLQLSSSSDLGLVNDPSMDLEDKYSALIERLRHIPGILLVLDNANDAEDLNLRKSQLSSLDGSVLITGRAKAASFVEEGRILGIDVMTPSEATQLFKRHYTLQFSDEENVLVEEMLKEAFYHPKLIEIIAKACQANPFQRLKSFREIVGKKQYADEEINYPIEIDAQTRKVYRVLLDLFNTDRLSEGAKEILRYFAILPSIDVFVGDLANLLKIDTAKDRQAFMTALKALSGGGWLDNQDDRYFSMHGLVQWVIRQRLAPSSDNTKDLIIGLADALEFKQTESPIYKQKFVLYTREWLELFGKDLNEHLGRSFNNLGVTYNDLGNYAESLSYHHKAISIRESILPSDHPDLITSYNNIAKAHHSLGHYHKALSYLHKAFTICEKNFASNNPHLATCLNNMGLIYRSIGNYQEALSHLQRAFSIWVEILPSNNSELATCLNNLGLIYRSLGNYQEALNHLQKAFAIWIEALPSNHPDLATCYNNLGLTYRFLGNYQEALNHLHKAYSIWVEILPSNHRSLAVSYNNLGLTHRSLGNYQEALNYHHKAFSICESVLPSNHPDLASSYISLAEIYHSLSDYQEALTYLNKAISILEAVVEFNHPDLAQSYYNLGLTYQSLGDYQNALTYLNKALSIQEEVLPNNHPELGNSYNNLATIYAEMMNFNDALIYFHKALVIMDLMQSVSHSNLQVLYNNLAVTYRALGDSQQEFFYLQKANFIG